MIKFNGTGAASGLMGGIVLATIIGINESGEPLRWLSEGGAWALIIICSAAGAFAGHPFRSKRG